MRSGVGAVALLAVFVAGCATSSRHEDGGGAAGETQWRLYRVQVARDLPGDAKVEALLKGLRETSMEGWELMAVSDDEALRDPGPDRSKSADVGYIYFLRRRR